MIKLIVFDWNGTLLADTRACMDADNFVIQNYGGKPFASVREFRAIVTIPAFDFYVARGCERKKLLADMKTVRAMFHNFYEKRACRCRLRKGARSLLRILNKKMFNVYY